MSRRQIGYDKQIIRVDLHVALKLVDHLTPLFRLKYL